ncbi:MAG: 2Fe-2S iron-sulfur cluster-binding protein [Vicinamibacterales bacterium]
MRLRVTDIRDEAEGIRSFDLRDPGGAELPPFEAGAHIEVTIEWPDGRTAARHYSLLGDPRDQSRYRIAVLLEPAGRGGSRFMHERVETGSSLRVGSPANGFSLREADHTILIAGGIGITPILSMARTLGQQGRSFEVHYAARTPARMAFRDELEAVARGHAHFHVTGADPRRFDLAAILAAPVHGARAYACGPPAMIRAVSAASDQAGWPKDRIHFEGFGLHQRPGDRAITVTLERSGLTVEVAPGVAVLDALLDAGVWAPHECRRGTCGSCMTRVVAGEPDHRDVCLPEALRDQFICTCVSRARTGYLTLDL